MRRKGLKHLKKRHARRAKARWRNWSEYGEREWNLLEVKYLLIVRAESNRLRTSADNMWNRLRGSVLRSCRKQETCFQVRVTLRIAPLQHHCQDYPVTSTTNTAFYHYHRQLCVLVCVRLCDCFGMTLHQNITELVFFIFETIGNNKNDANSFYSHIPHQTLFIFIIDSLFWIWFAVNINFYSRFYKK